MYLCALLRGGGWIKKTLRYMKEGQMLKKIRFIVAPERRTRNGIWHGREISGRQTSSVFIEVSDNNTSSSQREECGPTVDFPSPGLSSLHLS